MVKKMLQDAVEQSVRARPLYKYCNLMITRDAITAHYLPAPVFAFIRWNICSERLAARGAARQLAIPGDYT